MRLSHSSQKRKILHAAGANLDHVSVTFNQVDTGFVESFSDNSQSVSLSNLGKNPQPLLTESLKSIGRCTWLECTAAIKPRAASTHSLSHSKRLGPAFYCTRTSNYRQL